MTLQISIRSSPTLPFVLVPAYLLFWCCLEHLAAEAISKQEPSPAVLYRHGQTQTLPRSNIIKLLQRCQITNLVQGKALNREGISLELLRAAGRHRQLKQMREATRCSIPQQQLRSRSLLPASPHPGKMLPSHTDRATATWAPRQVPGKGVCAQRSIYLTVSPQRLTHVTTQPCLKAGSLRGI